MHLIHHVPDGADRRASPIRRLVRPAILFAQPIDVVKAPPRIVRLKLSALGEDCFLAYDSFLQELGRHLVGKQKSESAEDIVLAGWKRPGSPSSKLTWIVQQSILPHEERLLLVIEHLDRLHRCSFLDDFLGLLRSWNQKTIEPWPRLRLILTLSTLPAMLEGFVHSPLMNVATTVEVQEFSRLQLHQLIALYQLHPLDTEIDTLYELTGGQPYLLRRALFESVVQRKSLKDLLGEVFPDGGIFKERLFWFRRWLHQHQLFDGACSSK